MKILVTGASGLVGEQVLNAARNAGFEADGTCFRQDRKGLFRLDITDRNSVKRLVGRLNPDCIVHSAAMTNVDYCEGHKEEAWKVNVEGTRNLAESTNSCKFIYISTDYVFDGRSGPYTEDSLPNPVNYYGKTKLEGEKVASLTQDWIIARTTWIFDFSPDTKNFVCRLADSLKKGRIVKVPNDQIANPTLSRNLAAVILKLIQLNFSGIINISGSTRIDKYGFACAVARHFSLDASLINGVNSAELGQTAQRPKNAGFRLEKIEGILGERMEPLHSTLSKFGNTLP